jgi:MazG family protein
MSAPADGLPDLVTLVRRLRADCPWDAAQTPLSMRPYLTEELYELLDAIDAGDGPRQDEELGDLLFVVLLLAEMAGEAGRGGVDAVAAGIHAKMVRRHPHVFGEEPRRESGSIAAWEARKAASRAGGGRLDGVPRALPALLRAHRQAEKAAAVGFDWPDAAGVLAKVEEELGELRAALASGEAAAVAHEYGDTLMALASLGRHIGASPEESLRSANDRFSTRFRHMERIAAARGLALDALGAAALDDLWGEAKAAEAAAAAEAVP